MKMNVTETVKQACGHWPRILPALGVKVIKNRHQSCPVCGGSDRFRFDDKEGRGTWFCNQCGAGDGLKLVEKVFSVSASEAAGKVNADRQSVAGCPGSDCGRKGRNCGRPQSGGRAGRQAHGENPTGHRQRLPHPQGFPRSGMSDAHRHA